MRSNLLIFALLLAAASPGARAQNRMLEKAVPPPPPPLVEEVDVATEPQVTIRKRQGETVAEYRINNRLYMMKVTRDDGREFYLIDEQGNGQFVQRDAINTGLRVPMWVIKSW